MAEAVSSPANRAISGERTRIPVVVPARVERSARVVWRTSRPWETMTTSSTVSSISERRCEETSTDRPVEAWWRMKVRSHWIPWGSSPLAGSSRMRISGSPRRAVASCSRWRMPRENFPTRRRATSLRPTRSSVSATRETGMPAPTATILRWSSARRDGWKLVASRTAPTWWIGWSIWTYRRPPKVALPPVISTRPSSMRRVVVFPEPLGPRKPVTRPAATSKLRSLTASTPLNCLVRWSISMAEGIGRPYQACRAGTRRAREPV